jgi:halimadienyl-diphosphate synthase
MTAVEADGRPSNGTVADVDASARDLINGLISEPWGQISPSVYETGRLVTLAPWLTGHTGRLEFLLSGQRSDGGWGQPDGYDLVPTLSATEALLTAARRGDLDRHRHVRVNGAADQGLRRLFTLLTESSGAPTPDTPAIELIVPALVESLNRHLDQAQDAPPGGVDHGRAGGRLPLPAGMNESLLTAVRSTVAQGSGIPQKLLHSLEVTGADGQAARFIRPTPPGVVGASPAATAAWLTHSPRDPDAVAYLEAVVSRHGGAAPSVIPVPAFERAWVLATLLGAGIRVSVPAPLVADLSSALGETGTPGGPGLPPDADTTSATLYTLAQLGVPRGVDCLWAYEVDTHFCTWHGERTPSTTTNAHVLEAFGHHAGRSGDAATRERAVVDKLSTWLVDQQLPDGRWVDKWHASPYYATMCSVLALHRFARDRAADAVRRATAWVLATQRDDGSWGRWRGTVEESAYAVQILLLAGAATGPSAGLAAARGYAYLQRSVGRQPDTPLWHDKDLYVPAAVVRAAVVAALHLARGNPTVVSLAV